ncbi:MAG: hypothetical protein KUG77_21825 [Nannocystaceae bacterium]|nr:hypothetical protein [Nannocystaceae bacterium]
MQLSNETSRSTLTDERGVSILARSLFKEMRMQGYSPDQIVGLSSELIELVRDDLRSGLAAE